MKENRSESCYVRVFKNGEFLMALSLSVDADEVVNKLLAINRGDI